MKRVRNKWEVIARVNGRNIWVGAYDYRSQAIKAEEIVGTINAGIRRYEAIDRFKGKTGSFEREHVGIE